MALTAFECIVCQKLINPVSEMLRKALMGIQKFILGSSNFGYGKIALISSSLKVSG